MSDEKDDMDFEAYILENKEKVKALLSEDTEFKSFVKGELKSMKKKAKKKVKKAERKVDERFSDIKEALFSPEVQKHLVGAGIELMLGIGALMGSLPKSERAKDAMERMSEVRKNASAVYCSKNPDCPKKKAEVKKIELE